MRRTLLAVVAVVALAATSVSAHHGYANFDRDHPVRVEGTLVSLLYGNPHVVMTIRSADSTIYRVTWQAASWVEREAGVTKTTFKVGDDLVIRAAPARDPASHELASVRAVQRPSDGWNWRLATHQP